MKKIIIEIIIITILFSSGIANAGSRSDIDSSNLSQKVSWEEIKGEIENFVIGRLPWDRSSIEVKFVSKMEDVMLPAGNVIYEVESSNSSNQLGKKVFAIIIKIDGNVYKKIWVNADTSVMTDVVVAMHPLKRNSVINEDDISTEKMNIAALPEDVILKSNLVIGKKLNRFIKANTPIRDNMLSDVPLIKQKDKVVLVAESKGIKITTMGEAIEDGYKGGMIRVINVESKKEVFGRVVSPSLVKVEY